MTIANGTAASVQGCLEACERCGRVLDAITPEHFARTPTDHQPIGAHLRHALEHMICFTQGLPDGLVDYDARARDEIMERDPEIFRKALHELMDSIRSISSERMGDVIRVRQTVSLDTEPVVLESTIGRELAFLSSHTIHHLALVVQFCREEGIDFPEEMSLAYSTSAYLKNSLR